MPLYPRYRHWERVCDPVLDPYYTLFVASSRP